MRAAREFFLLLLFFLVLQFELASDNNNNGLEAEEVIITLITQHLMSQNIVLVIPSDGANVGVDLNRVLKTHPLPSIRGSLLAAIILTHHDPPTLLLNHLLYKTDWNPAYLVIIFLHPPVNSNTAATTVLSHPVVQRSRYILLLLRPSARKIIVSCRNSSNTSSKFCFNLRPQFFAYTSFPTQRTPKGLSLLKAPLGPWNALRHNFDGEKKHSSSLFHGEKIRFSSLLDREKSRSSSVLDGEKSRSSSLLNGDKIHRFSLLHGQNIRSSSLFPPRFTHFGGKVLKVSILCVDEPFAYENDRGECVGMNIDALELMADKLGFRYVLDPPDDIEWGLKLNGTWTGMFGHMLYGNKHLIINEMQPTLDRIADFDYTYPYWEDGFGIMVPNPAPLPRWRNVLHPFSVLTWVLLALTTVLCSSLFAFLLTCYDNTGDSIGIALKVFGALVSQSAPHLSNIQTAWVRIWLIVWWITVGIFASMYSGNLVAWLTVTVFPPILRTVQHLALSDQISFVPEALRTSDNPAFGILGRKLFLPDDVDPDDTIGDLVKLVLRGDHAIISTLDHIIFNQHRRNLTQFTYILEERLRINEPLTTEHLQGAFILHGIGILSALFILMLERLLFA
ncbi:hypothetical protein Pmani_011565 [Petrolisthes manimaculis]|uniref:Ionotropic glutamate receptor L-glutamate and glycine-binding domain-containing protein n=1 Tax=Petrolisthes manimaculis TaxID=1843537 RepID=A0AAE1UB22_9EUCA|nr:hypothetical protein Pmani_011565 [Petrolisthes manimaculis]